MTPPPSRPSLSDVGAPRLARAEDGALAPAPVRRPAPADVGATHGADWRDLLLRVLREALLVVALLGIYRAARLLTAGEETSALQHARALWNLQERLPLLPSELTVQSLALDVPGLGRAANVFYASAHFPLTALTLLWLLLRGSPLYRRTRDALGVTTGVALVLHLALPVAPPRMLTDLGFIDTGRLLGPAVYSTGDDTFVNQFAAMPSLHVAWALLVALALAGTSASRWRRLWLLYPTVTLAVVVITANHFWLDAVVGALIAVAAWCAAALWQPAGPVDAGS